MTVASQKTHTMADKVLKCVLVTFLLNSIILICITWILYWYISLVEHKSPTNIMSKPIYEGQPIRRR